jgi:serine beta-lactamase-like protein LACTB
VSGKDYLSMMEEHLSGGFLKPETVATLFTSQKTVDGTQTRYGIGWSLVVGAAGMQEVRHLGDTVGGQAFLVLYPEMQLVIALACTGNFWNYHGDGSAGATDRLAALFVAP